MMKHAFHKSGFYHELYRSWGLKDSDLEHVPVSQLPVITKKMVRNNFYKIAVKSVNPTAVRRVLSSDDLLPRLGDRYLVHTSGSTGQPANFLYGRHALNVIEANFARMCLGGDNSLSLKDLPLKNLYIAPVGSGYACTTLAMFGMKQYKCKSVVINAQTPIANWKKEIKDYKPSFLSGYPSCLALVAKLQERGEVSIAPKKIITGGEPVTSETRDYLKRVFGGDVIDFYGCTESILIGAGNGQHEGMYLFDDVNFLEVDEKNRLIITPLYNREFPLVRYQLTDVMEGFTKEQYGDLPFSHINKVMGRDEELMWFANQKGAQDFLHPLFIDDLNVKGIKRYQFVQKSSTHFELHCMSAVHDREMIAREIKKQMDVFLVSKNMRNVTYDVYFVSSIPVNKNTGKAKLVVKQME